MTEESGYPFVSVIVTASGDGGPTLRECLEACLRLDYPRYEVVLVSDGFVDDVPERVRFFHVEKSGPSWKRNFAIREAKGELCAFLDADAYPDRSWLREAVKHFDDPTIAIVGGPNVTPPTDGFRERISGLIYSARSGGGGLAFRYRASIPRHCDELPSVNLIVRRDVLARLGGFHLQLWPGEDAELCFAVRNQLGLGVLYVPNAVVYHHRRPVFLPHLRQVWQYGRTKAPLLKRYFRPTMFWHFLPSLIVLGLLASLATAHLHPVVLWTAIGGVAAYLLAVLAGALRAGKPAFVLPVAVGVVLTHVVYGLAFLRGLVDTVPEREAQAQYATLAWGSSAEARQQLDQVAPQLQRAEATRNPSSAR